MCERNYMKSKRVFERYQVAIWGCKLATVTESLSWFTPLSADEFRDITWVYAVESFLRIHICTLFVILLFLRLNYYTPTITKVIFKNTRRPIRRVYQKLNYNMSQDNISVTFFVHNELQKDNL
jgi:hypothetical protein